MNVAELIKELENMDPEAEVRLAFQRSYPFQYRVEGVYEVMNPDADTDLCPDPQDYENDGEYDEDYAEWEATQRAQLAGPAVVYLAEGGQLYSAPYLPANAAREIGWGR